MLTSRLFLGIKVCSPLKEELEKADKKVVSLFVNNEHPEALVRIDHEGVSYIGKPISPTATLTSVELLEMNVVSILQRISPKIKLKDLDISIFARVE